VTAFLRAVRPATSPSFEVRFETPPGRLGGSEGDPRDHDLSTRERCQHRLRGAHFQELRLRRQVAALAAVEGLAVIFADATSVFTAPDPCNTTSPVLGNVPADCVRGGIHDRHEAPGFPGHLIGNSLADGALGDRHRCGAGCCIA
jgi:hypothetical protein